MEDPNTTTKVESEVEDQVEETEELLSLESLDAIISEEDPDFSASLDEIEPAGEMDFSIYDEGLGFEYTLDEEIRRWNEGSQLRKKLLKLAPFAPKFVYGYKIRRTAFRLALAKEKIRTLQFIKDFIPNTKKYIKQISLAISARIASFKARFKSFSLVRKVLFISLIVLTPPLLSVVALGLKGRLVEEPRDLFIGSLQELSDQYFAADEVGKMESFYDSPRMAQNILLMRRMVVNLQRSAGSGPNPMGAFEFYVEGTSNEVLVEIKDREAEVEDLFARTVEEMSYDQVESAEGKRLLCDRLRREVNRVLTQGLVRKVFFKTAIIKP